MQDSSKRYFFVFKNSKLAGHIGLRNISFKMKHAEIGSFFADWRDRRGVVMEESVVTSKAACSTRGEIRRQQP